MVTPTEMLEFGDEPLRAIVLHDINQYQIYVYDMTEWYNWKLLLNVLIRFTATLAQECTFFSTSSGLIVHYTKQEQEHSVMLYQIDYWVI